MHSRHALTLGLLIVGALTAGWLMTSSKPLPPMAVRPPAVPGKRPVSSAPAQPVKPNTPAPPPPAPVLPPSPPAVVEAAPQSATKPVYAPPTPPAALDARKRYTEELDQVGLMLRDYRTLMKENPVGTNAEIMAALMGGNPKRARLGPPAGTNLNEQGELLDQWGTPYFFHQMSATVMEIHSAGPDKKMWTSDDVVVR